MSEQTHEPVRVTLADKPSKLGRIVTALILFLLVYVVVVYILPDWGIHIVTVPSQPAPTVRALPTTPPDPAPPRAQPAQAAPTALPVPPTPLPVGQPAPAVQAQPVEAAEGVVPAVVGPNPDAPAEISTRGAVCFGGWWYIDGQNMRKSCSGTGGD
jgi:hypothetical protein